jgi:hypothetical protein
MRKLLLSITALVFLLASLVFPPVTPVVAGSPEPPSDETLVEASGPLIYPAGVNPLTGLPEASADDLLLPPALVSISTFPPSVRPQSGLSYSPWVFELFIGEGM